MMNIELTEEHKLVRHSIRSFAEKGIAPHAGLMDKEAKIFPEVVEELAKMGLWGILIPEKYGGAESDTLSYIIIIEEISRICASTGLALSVHNALGTSTLINQGTEEQKSRFLFDLAAGKKIVGFSITEPNAGSDARGI